MKASRLLLVLLLWPVFLAAQSPVPDVPSARLVGLLPGEASGTSSLFFLDGRLWTCNDHGTLRLRAVDTLKASIDSVIDLGVSVYDLEEVTLDDRYIYFGDFGDNNGVRNDLRILRLSLANLRARRFRFDTIRFSYPDRSTAMARNFDCEAFIAAGDSLYLFTKQWLSQGSVCYSLPAVPGTHVARRRFALPTEGLVTAACYLPAQRSLVLLGYSLVVKPFVYVLEGFDAPDFHLGCQRRIALANIPGNQTEGLASLDGHRFFLTRESLDLRLLSFKAALLRLDLDGVPCLH